MAQPPEHDFQQRVWVQVDDEDAWALASVEERFGGSVYLKRSHAPEGTKEQIVVSEDEFGALSVATGDLEHGVSGTPLPAPNAGRWPSCLA